MKAIVVVFSAVCNGHAAPEPTLGPISNEPLPQLLVLKGGNEHVPSVQRDHSPPPFWTWFIENPRRRSA